MKEPGVIRFPNVWFLQYLILACLWCGYYFKFDANSVAAQRLRSGAAMTRCFFIFEYEETHLRKRPFRSLSSHLPGPLLHRIIPTSSFQSSSMDKSWYNGWRVHLCCSLALLRTIFSSLFLWCIQIYCFISFLSLILWYCNPFFGIDHPNGRPSNKKFLNTSLFYLFYSPKIEFYSTYF